MFGIKKVLISVTLGIVALLLFASPVLATAVSVPEPDSAISIIKVYAYENVLAIGDELIEAEISIPYATPPSTPATQAFLGRMLDATGTDVGDAPITAYYVSGYNYNTFSLYYTTQVVPWQTTFAYTLNLDGSPTITWTGGTGIYPSFSIPASSFTWRTSASIKQTQALIYGDMMSWATQLSAYWNTALTTINGSTTVLSTVGTAYFLQMTPGLQQMSPQMFSNSTSVPTYIQQTANTSAATAVTKTWPFDFTGIAQWLGFPAGSDSVFRGLVAVALIIALATVLNAKVPLSGIPASWAALIAVSAVGWITPVLCAGICFLAAVLFGLIFLLGKPIA